MCGNQGALDKSGKCETVERTVLRLDSKALRVGREIFEVAYCIPILILFFFFLGLTEQQSHFSRCSIPENIVEYQRLPRRATILSRYRKKAHILTDLNNSIQLRLFIFPERQTDGSDARDLFSAGFGACAVSLHFTRSLTAARSWRLWPTQTWF